MPENPCACDEPEVNYVVEFPAPAALYSTLDALPTRWELITPIPPDIRAYCSACGGDLPVAETTRRLIATTFQDDFVIIDIQEASHATH